MDAARAWNIEASNVTTPQVQQREAAARPWLHRRIAGPEILPVPASDGVTRSKSDSWKRGSFNSGGSHMRQRSAQEESGREKGRLGACVGKTQHRAYT